MNRIEARKAAEALAQFDEDMKLLMANREELLSVHPKQWAAVYKGDIIVAHTLQECIKALGENAPFAAMTFLDPTRKTFILGKGPQSLNPLELLAGKPYTIQHHPNCPSAFLVRTMGAGRGRLDQDLSGKIHDNMHYGNTLAEAVEKAIA